MIQKLSGIVLFNRFFVDCSPCLMRPSLLWYVFVFLAKTLFLYVAVVLLYLVRETSRKWNEQNVNLKGNGILKSCRGEESLVT